MLIETFSSFFRKVRATNATDNGFPSRVPTATKPSGIGDSAAQATASAVLRMGDEGTTSQNTVIITPIGAGADTDTFSLRVIGWTLAKDGDPSKEIWIPVVLTELLCTLSTPVGLAGKLVTATDRFADTIAITTGNANVSVEAVSNANDTIAHAVVDIKGFQLVEITFTTGGSATSCNALLKVQ